MPKKKKKIPNSALEGSSNKEIRKAHDIPDSFDPFNPSWQFNLIDCDGPYGWSTIDTDAKWEIFSQRIKDKEHLTWVELQQAGSHNIPVYKLSKDARKRLEEIQQEDLDQLFSLRLTGKERIWGIRDRYTLKILWWDPDHKVYPYEKKHT